LCPPRRDRLPCPAESASAATPAARSALDNSHIPFVVPLPSGRCEVVQPLDLLGAQLDTIGGAILLDAGDPPAAL